MEKGNYYSEKSRRNAQLAHQTANDCPAVVQRLYNSLVNGMAASTVMTYMYDIKEFFFWYGKRIGLPEDAPLTRITDDDIAKIDHVVLEDYFGALVASGLKENRRARVYSALNSLFSYIDKDNNPLRGIKRAKIAKRAPIVRLVDDEPSRLLGVVRDGYEGQSKHESDLRKDYKSRDEAILTLLLTIGIRVSECAGLNICDVDFNRHTLAITRKGGFKQEIALGESAEGALQNYLIKREQIIPADAEDDKALFLTRQKKRMQESSICAIVKKYAAALGLNRKITPHKLRKTYGTNLYNATGDILLVANALGHTNINTTAHHYIESDAADLQRVKDITPLS